MMRLERASTTRRNEDGVFLVLYALMLVAIFAMVAIVLDLSAVRNGRRISRSAADAAATAGALDLGLGPKAACETAMDYAARNLGGFNVPGAPCVSIPTICDGSTVATQMDVGDYRVFFRNAVWNTDAMMKADTPGGDINQSSTLAIEGEPCKRVGISITYTRRTIFSRVAGITQNETSVHSVARQLSSQEPGAEKPALVALHPTDMCTVDSGPGTIHALATGTQPALIYADSDGTGPNCSGGSNTVFEGKNTGRIWADPSPSGSPGELGYFAATEAVAFDTQPSYDENGALPPPAASKVKLPQRITRRPLDKIYNCASVVPVAPAVPGCTTGPGGTDLIDDVSTRYGNLTGAPGGFTVFPGAAVAGTCNSPPTSFPAGQNWYINCANFEVSSVVTFQNRDVVFAGDVEIKGGGTLSINSLNTSDSIVVIRGTTGVMTASGGWALDWRRTFVLMDNFTCSRSSPATCGVLQFQAGQPSRWTPPLSGGAKDLIYWTESNKVHAVQGNPNFFWEGIFAAPNSLFDVQGYALVDASEVQLWVSKARVNSNSAELRLRADPDKSISTSRSGSALIR